MIIQEFKVLNIKTGKIIVMNDNSIKALKKHNLWHGFDILEQPKKIESIVQTPIVIEPIIEEMPVEISESKSKRKYTKK